jgi:hypothetical protein
MIPHHPKKRIGMPKAQGDVLLKRLARLSRRREAQERDRCFFARNSGGIGFVCGHGFVSGIEGRF